MIAKQMPRRFTELDGMRGLAAILVVTAHYFGETAHGIRALTFGWVGVDLFFVLSGFLIGGIILDNHAKPGFFRKFYLRRAARIIPIYALVIAATLVAAAWTAGRVWSDHPFGALVYGLFGTNVAMMLWGGGGEWLMPTWTLAVENQFYLITPLLIVATPRRLIPALLISLFAGALFMRLLLVHSYPIAALTQFSCRCDLLIAGVGIAFLHRTKNMKKYLVHLRVLPLASMLALLALVSIIPGSLTTWGQSIFAIGLACFLGSVINGAPEGRRYNAPVLRWFGQISYALYLVHQPIDGLLHGLILGSKPDGASLVQIAVSMLALGTSVGVAALSWHWLEAPILRMMEAWQSQGAVEGKIPTTGSVAMG